MHSHPVPIRALALAVALTATALASHAVEVSVTNLVTDDQAANPAQVTDPGLLNGWGISYSSTSPFWVSSNGGGTSVLYRVDPLTQATTKVGLTVTIPGAGNVTGQVFNAGGASQFNGNAFLFVSEDGTVSGWRGSLGTAAETLASANGIYKGAAIATRKRVLSEVADQPILVIGTHFAAPTAGRIRRDGAAFVLESEHVHAEP